jgi:hypothetical protein
MGRLGAQRAGRPTSYSHRCRGRAKSKRWRSLRMDYSPACAADGVVRPLDQLASRSPTLHQRFGAAASRCSVAGERRSRQSQSLPCG